MKMLIIQLAKMGDLYQSRKLINNVMSKYQNAEIYLLINDLFVEVAETIPKVKIIPIYINSIASIKNNLFNLSKNENSKRLITILNNFSFDYIINLNSSKLAIQIADKINSKVLGFSSKYSQSREWLYFWMSFIKNRKYSTINLVDLYAGIEHKENKISHFKWNDNPNDILIQVGSRNSKRIIPMNTICGIINKLIEMNKNVTLIGVTNELSRAQEIKKNCPGVNSLVGKTNISELIKEIKKSDLLITGDTGTMHIAAWENIQILALFYGSAYFYETAGYSNKIKILTSNTNCYPCPDEFICNMNLICHKEISENDIMIAIFNEYKKEKTPFFDEIGINFNDNINYHLYIANIFRCFAINYFLRKNKSRKKITDFEKKFIKDWKNSISLQIDDFKKYNFGFVYYWKKLLGNDFINKIDDWIKK